jgi:hypothetical protein
MTYRSSPTYGLAARLLVPLFAILAIVLGCNSGSSQESKLREVPASKPAEIVDLPPMGGMTAIDEVLKVKAMVVDIAKRPVRCDCKCKDDHPYAARQAPEVPAVRWRVDPLNGAVLQLGYEANGIFWVITTTPVATRLPP